MRAHSPSSPLQICLRASLVDALTTPYRLRSMRSRAISLIIVAAAMAPAVAAAQGRGRGAAPAGPPTLLVPDRVWDGFTDAPHEGWAVLVRGDRIESVGPRAQLDAAGATTISLPGTTLMPGLIEAHSHM